MALKRGTPEYEAALADAVKKFDEELPRRLREIHRGGFTDLLKMAWSSIWHMGMYSSDPQIARMAIVHTAQEQIGIQRQISAQQHGADQASEIQRAQMLGRIQADAMIDRIEERRASQ